MYRRLPAFHFRNELSSVYVKSNKYQSHSNTMTSNKLVLAMLCIYTGITLWLGSLAFFGIGVAPVIFKTLPSKDLAGALNAVILHRLNMLELAGAVSIGIGFVLLFATTTHNKRLLLPMTILLVMVALWCVYALALTPQMNDLRGQINSFDAPDAASLPLVQTFRGYHQWYSRLVGANMFAGLALLVLQTRQFLSLAQRIDA
jgi:hypothetical protein